MSAFFGLKEEDKEIYWEQIFLLIYYCGISYTDAYNMPVPMLIWFIRRLQRELAQSEGDDMRNASPEMRTYMGSQHPHAPKKLKR